MNKKILTLPIVLFLFGSSLAHAKIDPPTPTSPQESTSAKQKLAKINNKITNLKKEINVQKHKEALVLKELTQTETKLNKTTQTLQMLMQHIDNKKTTVAQLSQTIDTLTQKQKKYEDVLTKSIQLKFESHLQKNRGFNTTGSQTKNQIDFYHYYVKAQEKYISQLITELSDYALLKQTAAQEKIALETLQAELRHENNKLQVQQAHTKKMIPTISIARKYKTLQLSDLVDEQRQLETLIQKLSNKTVFVMPKHEALSKSPHGSSIPVSSRLHKFVQAAGKLPLPIYQKQARLIKNKQSKFIIPAQPGTAIHAIYAGRVIFAEWLRGLGLLIILDHGDGYMSLYGNNQKLYKKTGDWVNAHEEIASLGNMGSKPDTGLYFEIRKNGQALNLHKWMEHA